MNAQTLTTFFLALALALPMTLTLTASEAFAGPGSTLKSSRKKGKRTHKRANAKRTKKKSKKSKASKRSSKTTTRRTMTTRRSANRRTVRRTTTSRSTNRRTTRRTTRTRTVRKTPRRRVVRRTTTRTTRRSPTTRHRTKVVHHHHSSSSATASTSASSNARPARKSSIEAYITGGLGYSGFAAPTITDDALPGAGYNVALGVKGKYLGFEFGFNGSGHTFDPEAATTDLAVLGLSGDLKLQPSFGFFEPYALAGVGGYSLQDGIIDEASGGAALRLGAGADFRFDDAALGVRYLHSQYGFADDSGIYGGDFGASSETLGINLSFYF